VAGSQLSKCFWAAGVIVGWPMASWGQSLIPDGTLGNEASQVRTEIQGEASGSLRGPFKLIEGGAARGPNLFHSFQSFGVEAGQRVYFASPSGIEQLFSRVTGNQASQIDGTLGVLGPADLFLLNPNGILFGPGARLDISGSFTASTAETFDFTTGHSFGAVAPQDDTLLSINVPVGLQFNHTLHQPTQGEIVTRGQLEAGQDLALLGKQLYLEGRLKAEGDLTLKAEETMTVRDTAAEAFVAQAGGDLTLQGNQGIDILTLQHLEQTPFMSGGDLTLLSDGEISGDAHFRSGGDLRFLTLAEQPGRLVSLYDPILSADGDLVFGDYTGVALKLEATGSIEAGNIEITGPDTTLVADGSGSDEDLLASSRAAIFRAGEAITVGSINTSNQDGGDGGHIILVASGDITTTGAFQHPDGFPVALGSFSFSTTDDVGKGGDISLSSGAGNIAAAGGSIESSAIARRGQSGGGGTISISSTSGNILAQNELRSLSVSSRGGFGHGGDILISSISGDITTQQGLEASSFGTSPGRTGGNISLISSSGAITTGDNLNSFSLSASGRSGNGGDILISSASGDIFLDGSLSAFSSAIDENGNGGNILVSSVSGNITTLGNLNSLSLSNQSNSGNAGNISLTTQEGSIIGNQTRVVAPSVASVGGKAGTGGNIQLKANQISGLDIFTLSSAGTAGDVEIQGLGDRLTINNLRIITSGQFEVPGVGEQDILLDRDDFGQAGNTIITNAGDIEFNAVEIQGDANGSRPAGDVTITSPGEVTFSNGQINSSANREGNAGEIVINAQRFLLGDGGQILAATTGSGNGGSITINATETIVLGEGVQDFEPVISVEASASGRAGNILINTPKFVLAETARITATATQTATGLEGGGSITLLADQMNLAGGGAILAETEGQAPGGVLTLAPYQTNPNLDITLAPGAQLSASTSGSGPGGNINLTAPQSIRILGAGSLSAETRGSGTGGVISIAASSLEIAEGTRISTTAKLPQPQLVETVSVTGDFFDQIDVDAGGPLPTAGSFLSRFTFTVPETGAMITDLDLRFSVAHPSTGELLVRLESPEGTVTQLFAGIGGEGDNFQDTLLNDAVTTSIQAGIPPFIGSFGPALDGALNVFNGENATGTWTLEVNDFAAGNDGGLFRAGEAAPWGTALGTQLLLSTQNQGITSVLVPVPPPTPTFDNPNLGQGGTIRIEADQLNLSNSSILAETEGFTRGGDINLSASQLTLDNSNITVRSLGSGDSGSINIDSSSALLLSNGSLIETNAGGSGNGGNIAITTPFLIGLPGENSDIIANAMGGDGGRVDIAAQNLLNFQQRDAQTFSQLRSNLSNDISASSETGTDGTVTLDIPDLDPANDLALLPLDLVDSSELIERTVCSVSNKSEFRVTGRGGVPAGPTDTLSTLPVWEDGEQIAEQPKTPLTALVEAQRWSTTVDGKVLLYAAIPSAMRTRSPSCQTIQEVIKTDSTG